MSWRDWIGAAAPLPTLTTAASPASVRAAVAPPQEPVAEPQRYSGYRSPWANNHIARGITASQVATLLTRAEQGYPGDLCRLLADIERSDLHIQAELGKRRRAVVTTPWRIVPVSSKRQDRRVAEAVTHYLGRIRRLKAGMLRLLDAVGKGFAVTEMEWEIRDGVALVTDLAYRPQWWFVPDLDTPGRWRVLDERAGFVGLEPPPYRLLVHEAQSSVGWAWNAGLGHALVWYYLFKRYALGDWLSYAELFGAPLRVGRFGQGAKAADIDKLEQALDKLGVDAWAAIPDTMKVEFVQAGTSAGAGGAVYKDLVSLCDRQISIGVLGQTLTTTEGASGSRALGDVHADVRFDLLRSDCEELAETLTDGLVAPLVRFNLGANVEIPRFEFVLIEPEDVKAREDSRKVRVETLKEARALGVPLSISQVREDLGLRAPDSAEDELAGVTVKPELRRAGQMAASDEACARCGGLHTFAEVPEHLQSLETAVAALRSNGGDAAWAAVVEGMTDVLSQATAADELADVFIQAVEALDLEEFAQALADATLTADLVGRLHIDAQDGKVDDVPSVPPREAIAFWTVEKAVVTPAMFKTMSAEHKSRAFTIAGWHSLTDLAHAKDAMEAVLAGGGTMADLEDELETWRLKIASPRHLEAVYRNNTATAYGVGRYRQSTRPATLARRPFWRLMTVEDSRVRATHTAQHGKVYRAGHAFWLVWYPPNGPYCRCYVVTLSAEDVKRMGLTVEEDLPVQPGDGQPMLPDEGWQRNPALHPHEVDFSGFPSPWRAALGV